MTLSFREILVFFLSAILGSIPFAIVIGKVFYGVDVRKQGSGNPGATNTLRVLGKKAGIAVLLLDIGKGALAVFLGYRLVHFRSASIIYADPDIIYPCICAALAVLGHVFSPFLKFKGGKGVATSIGVVLALQPIAALVMIVTFILILMFTRYVSLGSIIGAVIYPLYNLIFYTHSLVLLLFSIGLAALILIRHKDNIARLIKGQESKFGKKQEAAV